MITSSPSASVVWVVVGGAAIAVAGTWVLAKLAPMIGAVARVQHDRWHTSGDVPRFAGPALLLAMWPWIPPSHMVVLSLICAIGVVDDIRSLPPLVKGTALLLVAAIAGWMTGVIWVGVAVWFVSNAVNLLDHADGVAAAALAAAFVGAGGEAGLAGAGACLGFLILNYPPARAFMGDGGSLLLGAAIVLATFEKGPLSTIAWTAIPLVDACFVVVRRLAGGRKPWIGGTDHTGHALLAHGVPLRLLPVFYAAATLVVGYAVVA
jgi:UDP-GlcNAc:undecaprenyl-phosphate GlcNAc-1-phosphate transferase